MSDASKRLLEAAKELRVRLVEHGLRYGEQCQISHHELLAAIRDAEREAAEEWRSIADAARWPEGSVVVERQVYADESLGVRNFQLHEFWRPDLRVSYTEWLLTQGVISGFKLIAEPKGSEA